MTDNETIKLHSKYPNAFKINRTLDMKLGWLKEMSTGNYVLGPNLRQEFFTDIVLGLQNINVSHDLGDGCELEHGKDKPVFCVSVACKWRFMNLNQAFETVDGTRRDPSL